MCNEIPEIDKLEAEFRTVAQKLDEILKDIEWRKPDVEAEEKKLRQLKRAALKDPGVDVYSQSIVVRVGRSILDDMIKEANSLEKHMKELRARIEKAMAAEEKQGEGEGAEEGVPEEKD